MRVAFTVAIAICCLGCGVGAKKARLRVCADPNNLPFSNQRAEGFENLLADIVARDSGQTVEYTWWPQRRGFIRSTLNAGLCDLVMGVPTGFDMALTTTPYYRSSFAFVSRRQSSLHLSSMDDERLRRLSIGVHLVGDDYGSVPPAQALAARGLTQNMRGYSIYGDYAKPSPSADLIRAVADGHVDVAVVWGPLAGFFAAQSTVPLEVSLVQPPTGIQFEFPISMGVRRDDHELRDRLNEILLRRRADVEEVLDRFHVPRVAARESGASESGTARAGR
jgi:quinoprotein dehydrogenase-associated probable ABC transporter substrate-binding protein